MTVGKVKDLHSARIITLGRAAVVDTSAGTNPPQMNALDVGGVVGTRMACSDHRHRLEAKLPRP